MTQGDRDLTKQQAHVNVRASWKSVGGQVSMVVACCLACMLKATARRLATTLLAR